jgi:alpha/beta superfamily hydrolase
MDEVDNITSMAGNTKGEFGNGIGELQWIM